MPMLVGGLIDDLGFTEQQAGYVASLEGLGLVLASLVAALWVRKASWTVMLAIGCIATALLNVISANLSLFAPFLIVRFLAGFTAGSIFALTIAGLGDNRHPDRAFGIAQVMQGAVMFCAFAAAARILVSWSVSGLYYMLALASLLTLLALFRYPAAGAQRRADPDTSSEAMSHAWLIWIGLIASLLFFANVFGFWTYIERVGQTAGLSTQTIGLALGMSQFAAIVGAGATAIASDRFGRTLPLVLVLVGQLLVLWLLLGRFSTAEFYIGAALFQALFVIANSYQLGVIAKIDYRGNFLVLVTGFQGLGAAAGPAAAAALVGGGNYGRINLLAAVFCLSSILMFLFIIYRTRHIASPVVSTELPLYDETSP